MSFLDISKIWLKTCSGVPLGYSYTIFSKFKFLSFHFLNPFVHQGSLKSVNFWEWIRVMPLFVLPSPRNPSWFLGGLSLHLNHLIQSCMEISYRLFGTLPIGLLLSNLDSRQLETSPMTSYDQFWNMSTFGDSRAVWVICQKKMPSENQFFLDEGATRLQWGLGFLGGQVPRL